jgi:hypothetical protein
MFRPRFNRREVPAWASRYLIDSREKRIQNVIVPKVKEAGCIERASFLVVCKWKTPRSHKRCLMNPADFVREVTRIALMTPNERLRVEILRVLDGVDWPTASVILHWFHADRYPILDFRALWSLSTKVPSEYDFDFWWRYTKFCRKLASRCGVDMRTLDRALWQYSKERQR